MSKALVISGGGAKGAYAVGFLQTMNDVDPGLVNFKTYVGTSTGSLIAPFMALGMLNTLVEIYSTTEDKDVLKQKSLRNLPKRSSLFTTKPLEKLINNSLSDFDCERLINDATKSINLCTTCLQTKGLTVFTTSDTLTSTAYDVIRITSPAALKAAMLASANQPILMPPVRVNLEQPSTDSLKNLQYVDGGVVEYAGTEVAMDSGVDHILTILLSTKKQKIEDKLFSKIFDIAGATLSTFTEDVGRNDLRIPNLLNDGLGYVHGIRERLKNNGVSDQVIDDAFNNARTLNFRRGRPYDIDIIRPSKMLFGGAQGLKFIPKNMAKMMELGALDAEDYIRKINTSGPGGPIA